MTIIKHAMYSFLMIIMLVVFLLGIITVESRTNRENNAQSSLKRATDNAIESILENQNYVVHSNEEFVATLTEMICDSLISQDGRVKCENCGHRGSKESFTTSVTENNTEFALEHEILKCPSCGNTDSSKISADLTTDDKNLKLTIEIVDADYFKGLLSLNIVEEYTNPTGRIGTCEYATTVIFDEAKIYDTYTIKYYDFNGVLIESYIVRAGDAFPEPSDNIKNQYKITKWGSTLGGGGAEFIVPDTVPLDTVTNNISQYPQYDSSNKCLNLYGNYQP